MPNESGTKFLRQFCIHWPNATDTGLELECYSNENIMGRPFSVGAMGALIGILLILMVMVIGVLSGGIVGGLLGMVLAFITLDV